VVTGASQGCRNAPTRHDGGHLVMSPVGWVPVG
jgi:hypothetical protein